MPAPQWPDPVRMDASTQEVKLSVLGSWMDAKGTATVKAVFDAGLAAFQPKAVSDNPTLHPLSAQWVHFRVAAMASQRALKR